MPKYKVTASITMQYDLEIEADSQADVVDKFNAIEADNMVEELAVDMYAFNPYEIEKIEVLPEITTV